MKEAKLKTLEQSDNVSLYSICFDGNAISEYETFVQKFKDDVTSDCVKIIAKYYRDLNSLEAAFAGYDGLLKFFKGTFDVVDLNNKDYQHGDQFQQFAQ